MAMFAAIIIALAYYQGNREQRAIDVRHKQVADLILQFNRIEGYLLNAMFAAADSDGNDARMKASNASFASALLLVKDRVAIYDVLPESEVQALFAFLGKVAEGSHRLSNLDEAQKLTVKGHFDDFQTLQLRLTQELQSLALLRAVKHQQGLYWSIGLWALLVALCWAAMAAVKSRYSLGFANLHYIIERHKHKEYRVELDQRYLDEFSDFGHMLSRELTSQELDVKQQAEQLQRVKQAFAEMSAALLVTDDKGNVEWVSDGFEKLWRNNTRSLESLLGVDAGLDCVHGEALTQLPLAEPITKTIKLNEQNYVFKIEPLAEQGLAASLTFETQADLAELMVLSKAVTLMGKDIWSVPVRLLRKESACFDLSVALEAIRSKVSSVLTEVNSMRQNEHGYEEFTKLQQIATFIQTLNIDNEETPIQNLPQVSSAIPESLPVLDDIVHLSQQIKESVLLGFESALQKLALADKDRMAYQALLEDIERCLQEVRNGALHSLQATEQQAEQIRKRFAKDLNHDIDTVANRIQTLKAMSPDGELLEADHHNAQLRLENAQHCIEVLLERVESLLAGTLQGSPSTVALPSLQEDKEAD